MTIITFQIHTMQLEKLDLDKEKSAYNPLINTYAIPHVLNENSPRYQNNYIATLPITIASHNVIKSNISSAQQDHLTLQEIETFKEIETNEIKLVNELYETIALEKYDNREEKSSCKCNKNTLIPLCIVVTFMTAVASSMSYVFYLSYTR